jgi:hypothetical protein
MVYGRNERKFGKAKPVSRVRRKENVTSRKSRRTPDRRGGLGKNESADFLGV